MNKKQQELIDRAYDKFLTYLDDNQIFINSWDIDSFIRACTKNSEDTKMWGLKIEERELSREERIDLYCKEYTFGIRGKYEPPFDDFIDAKLKTRNIPTKLITITYNNEKIESYE